MIGRTNVSGGGGGNGGSELTIVGGTTRPAKATQSTIWINTNTEITSYALSKTEPESPISGMVWISIGNSGQVKMNSPIGGDWIMVYPLSAKQYVGGVWVNVEAKSYQNGVWVDWIVYLIKNSQIMTAVTGDWVAEARTMNAAASSRKPSIKIADGSIKFGYDGSGGTGGVVRASNKIDLTGKSKLLLLCDASGGSGGSNWLKLNVWTEMGTYESENCVATVVIPTGTNQVIELDVSSLNGLHYIGFFIYTDSGVTPIDLYVG